MHRQVLPLISLAVAALSLQGCLTARHEVPNCAVEGCEKTSEAEPARDGTWMSVSASYEVRQHLP